MSFLSTRAEFEACLLQFFNESNACSSEIIKWHWQESQSILKQTYLKRNTIVLLNKPTIDYTSFNLNENQLIEEENDPSIIDQHMTDNSIQLEHHIVYSTSYQVPVLYFKANYNNGTPLSHAEIYKYIISEVYQHIALSQNEHPILLEPFWYIHPCDTRTLMKTFEFKSLDYIKVWLSVYGPMVKCSMSTDMFK
ncbi:autophagocytosis associated protein [Cokeromyces recurvatus]|uniref:autophagocytosis associated protein n=1 Tax=Cokeromyces recurvatus TaxID=90255 RepID=UPI00221F2FA2|nr:autophagocytosis associated protein [Cokeromyces recurvatus]KAI7901844.1 autophagocytosis associated protein [Cokeromyces recurvatus]